MSEKCACETLKGTQCSFNRKSPSKYCGKHTSCKKDWQQSFTPKPSLAVKVEHQDVGCAAINKSNGKPCSYLAKSGDIYCGIHIKSLDESLSQAKIPVEARQVAPASYNVKRVKPDGRLSARWYWDTHPSSLGDRCDIRKDKNYNCLLVDSAGRPRWFAKSAKDSEFQKPCGDFAPRCKEPDFI
jgi:hypothetical protein